MTRRSAAILVGALAVALAIAVLVGPSSQKPNSQAATDGSPGTPPPATGPMMRSTPFTWMGIHCPPVKAAKDVKLADDAAVAGVVVHGKARAYLLKAMSGMTGHVVDDLIGDTPVTVTYCDQTDCLCGFTSDTPGKPLDVNLGGFAAGNMLLMVGRTFYWQNTTEPTHHNNPPPFPYQKLALERTTWKKWREAHPDTEVYAEMPRPQTIGGAR